ncbi:MAG TPA: DUF4190 domain-containing protein [Candidatus Angelobacter sp.]|nr:DUF4190 domain-containing protein [Candidatus Angelobacter sp.]
MYRIIGADGKEYGPISADQLRQWIAENRARASTPVLADGATEWKPLGSLPEFSNLFATPAAPNVPRAPGTSSLSARKNNGMAIAGFVLGLASFMTLVPSFFCCCFGFPLNILGIVFSIVGLEQINRHPHLYTGKSLAVAGLVLSVICIVAYIFLLAIGVISSQWHDGFSHHAQRL